VAGRPKKVATTKTKEIIEVSLPQVEKEYYRCPCCAKKYTDQDKGFYQSTSLLIKSNNGRMFICRKCVIELYAYLVETHEDTKKALYLLCRWIDMFFDASLYSSAEQQARNANSNIAQVYITKINSLPQYSNLSFLHSSGLDGTKNEFISTSISERETNFWSESDIKNKEDVIRMVGYDPFENENPMDKKGLYNSLVDMLDESTLEDSFKMPIVIEISKSFNQIDKINQALALMTADITNVSTQVGGIKSLFEAKDKMYRAILAMAKDNGISVNHATNKSKGAGTLSGIMKQLQERGFSEVEVNLFDIETSRGMQQVSELSNKAIVKQLMLDENDYTWMISEQKEMIEKQENKIIRLEEENRLIKIKIAKFVGDTNEQ